MGYKDDRFYTGISGVKNIVTASNGPISLTVNSSLVEVFLGYKF